MHSYLFAAYFFAGVSSTLNAMPLAVQDGRCTFVLDTTRSEQQYELIVGSLSRRPGPFRIRIHTEPATGPASLPVEAFTPEGSWRNRIQELNASRARARREHVPEREVNPVNPPLQKTFYVLTSSGRLQDSQSYTAVLGKRVAVGRHGQVYVDEAFGDPGKLKAAIADAVHIFDEEIYPRSLQLFGQVQDVDRDGRFTFLFTPQLARLQTGGTPLDGYVRGSDFYRDLTPPFSNRCDMMYLSTGLRPGPHLRTIIAHEYTHAIAFCEHVLTPYLPGRAGQEEESWLDEGLAHLAEEIHGYGWSNLEHRLRVFLESPERYSLVVPDYYGSGRWRDPGLRGAAFLFLHWCRTTQDDGFSARLIQSNLTGIANLEAATGEPFPVLFRYWTVSLLERQSAIPQFGGPRRIEVALAGGEQEIQLAGTAAAYLRLSRPLSSHTRVTILAEPGSELQLSLLPLPDEQRGSRGSPLPSRHSAGANPAVR